MNHLERQAMLNANLLVTSLKNDTDTITHAKLLDILRRPLPPRNECDSDAVIRHAYRVNVLNGGACKRHMTY